MVRSLLLLSLLLATTLPARAAEEPSAKEIVRRATDQGQPAASRQRSTMRLRDAKGGERVRVIDALRVRSARGEWSTRIELLEPKDVAGTVLLSVEKGGQTSQHLYLPGTKRVRRLAGSQRSGSFQGSDFTYEDLAPRDLGASAYRRLDDETVAGRACWVIEATPSKDAGSGYAKTILYVAKDDAVTLRVRFFDAKGELKVLEVDPEAVHAEGEVRIPKRLQMTSTRDGHVTVIEVESIDLSPPVDPSRFDPASLDRG